jgi:hypothetical protein
MVIAEACARDGIASITAMMRHAAVKGARSII